MPRLYHLNKYTALRKSLRNSPTASEKVLWQYLRQRRFHGVKFRRQESIGRYIVDFYCPEQRLVVEVDGPIHDSVEQQEYDTERTKWLRACFIKVVRVSNEEVLGNINGALDKIKKAMLIPTPQPPP